MSRAEIDILGQIALTILLYEAERQVQMAIFIYARPFHQPLHLGQLFLGIGIATTHDRHHAHIEHHTCYAVDLGTYCGGETVCMLHHVLRREAGGRHAVAPIDKHIFGFHPVGLGQCCIVCLHDTVYPRQARCIA